MLTNLSYENVLSSHPPNALNMNNAQLLLIQMSKHNRKIDTCVFNYVF